MFRCLQAWFGLWLLIWTSSSWAAAHLVETPYTEQRVVFELYLADPDEIGSALYWVRALLTPLLEEPYGYAPESLDLVVVSHGTEIVTLASKNYARYAEAVDRMRYYAGLGVKFKVCALAAADYGYRPEDFQDFVELVPSGITELAHWQLQGYALISPRVLERHRSIEEIR